MNSRTARVLGVVAAIAASIAASGASRADVTPIRVCQHTPITGAHPIPHDSARFGGFYFDYVNAELGGVDGRPVEFVTRDDGAYRPAALHAAEQCRDGGADLLLGVSAADKVALVADWADQHQMPYLHNGDNLPDSEWGASTDPGSIDQASAMADLLVANGGPADGAPPVYGMVRIDDPARRVSHDAFVQSLQAHDEQLAADIVVQADEGQFAWVYAQLIDSNVNVVVIDATSDVWPRMLNQEPSAYDPQYVALGGDIGYNIVAAALRDHRIIAPQSPGPVFDLNDESSPWRAEIDEFLRIFRAYSPEQDPPPDDFDWQFYLRAKQVHRVLLSLHGDLTPERIVDSFFAYNETQDASSPACALDFTRSPRQGAHAWHLYQSNDGRWNEAGFCASTDAIPDLAPPAIDCGPAPIVGRGEIGCTFEDGASGVDVVSVAVFPALGASIEDRDLGCRHDGQYQFTLPPGVHRVTVTATDCAEHGTTTTLYAVTV